MDGLNPTNRKLVLLVLVLLVLVLVLVLVLEHLAVLKKKQLGNISKTFIFANKYFDILEATAVVTSCHQSHFNCNALSPRN